MGVQNSTYDCLCLRLRRCECLQNALQRAEKALELDGDNWEAWRYKALFGAKANEETVKILTDAIQKMETKAETGLTWLDEQGRRAVLAELYIRLENSLWSIGKRLKVAAKNRLDYHKKSYRDYMDVLLMYGKAKAWDSVVDFLELLTRNNHWGGSIELLM